MQNASWLRKSVIYHIFIDRFYQSGLSFVQNKQLQDKEPIFCGGNIQGIIDRLDYVKELGATALWLSPFTKTANYHGYHVTDYFEVDERFGGAVAMRDLVKAAKSRGLQLIMDFVPNHVHVTHPWFQAAQKSKKSRFRDWFIWKRNGDYLKFLDVSELPKLNLENSEARHMIIKAAKFWLDQGIDGFRLDHAIGPSLDFWREFRKQLDKHKSEVALIGEVFFWGMRREFLPTLKLPDKERYFFAQQLGQDANGGAMKEYTGVFDGLLDFQFQKLLTKHVARAKTVPSKEKIQELLDEHYEGYPPECSLISFLDNHDLNRFLFEAGGNKTRLKQALQIQFAQNAPAAIYNGTEIGMGQCQSIRGMHGDLQARAMMDWPKMDKMIFSECKKLIKGWKIRQQQSAA